MDSSKEIEEGLGRQQQPTVAVAANADAPPEVTSPAAAEGEQQPPPPTTKAAAAAAVTIGQGQHKIKLLTRTRDPPSSNLISNDGREVNKPTGSGADKGQQRESQSQPHRNPSSSSPMPNHVVHSGKTLEQRESEYAAARFRLLGNTRFLEEEREVDLEERLKPNEILKLKIQEALMKDREAEEAAAAAAGPVVVGVGTSAASGQESSSSTTSDFAGASASASGAPGGQG